jgi:hypothetical protein
LGPACPFLPMCRPYPRALHRRPWQNPSRFRLPTRAQVATLQAVEPDWTLQLFPCDASLAGAQAPVVIIDGFRRGRLFQPIVPSARTRARA